MNSPRVLLVALLAAGCAFAQTPTPTPAPIRTWTTTDGKTFQAQLVSVQGTQVTVRLGNGSLAAIGLPRLSPADQAYVKPPSSPAGAPTPAPASASADKRVWPQKVEVDTRAIEVTVIGEDPANQKCVYRSRNFEFTAQDKIAPSVMKELSRTFEAMRSLIEALPWSIEPKPPQNIGFFPATFYLTKENFIAAGGDAKSSGAYLPSEHRFIVPFQSLGLEQHGKTWAKSAKYSDRTLEHDVANQMMGDSYRFLPSWMWVGTAEYAMLLPNNAGVIQAGMHERGVKEYIKRWANDLHKSANAAGPVIDVMQLTPDAWVKQARLNDDNPWNLQFASALLVYYFCHLDGDGKGTRFIRYMDKIAEARRAGISTGARGSFGFSQVDILLDGRDKDAMQKAVVEGYKKIGVRWP
jgi:hypothetical protein